MIIVVIFLIFQKFFKNIPYKIPYIIPSTLVVFIFLQIRSYGDY